MNGFGFRLITYSASPIEQPRVWTYSLEYIAILTRNKAENA